VLQQRRVERLDVLLDLRAERAVFALVRVDRRVPALAALAEELVEPADDGRVARYLSVRRCGLGALELLDLRGEPVDHAGREDHLGRAVQVLLVRLRAVAQLRVDGVEVVLGAVCAAVLVQGPAGRRAHGLDEHREERARL